MNLRFREMVVIALLAAGLIAVFNIGAAYAVSLKVWATGETIRSSDLNANFAALNAYTGTITDSRIDGNAQISHSKLKTPGLIPKAWVYVAIICTVSPCVKEESFGFGNINRTSTGKYTLNLSYGPKNTNFATLVTAKGNAGTNLYCMVTGQDGTSVLIECQNAAGTFTDAAFSVVVMDIDDP